MIPALQSRHRSILRRLRRAAPRLLDAFLAPLHQLVCEGAGIDLEAPFPLTHAVGHADGLAPRVDKEAVSSSTVGLFRVGNVVRTAHQPQVLGLPDALAKSCLVAVLNHGVVERMRQDVTPGLQQLLDICRPSGESGCGAAANQLVRVADGHRPQVEHVLEAASAVFLRANFLPSHSRAFPLVGTCGAEPHRMEGVAPLDVAQELRLLGVRGASAHNARILLAYGGIKSDAARERQRTCLVLVAEASH
mmetsp:Transcript_48415/g.135250  ORF Transcript_48415/g.135250 Transcript_48415/m.135250 type:complete len:248 (+) Transcript_48415:801-1544(+)